MGSTYLSPASSRCTGYPQLEGHRLVVHLYLLQMRIVLSCQAVPRMPRTCRPPHLLCSMLVDLLYFSLCVAACERAGMDSRGPGCSMFEAT